MADYYVHTTGSDSGTGADDDPFLTLQHAFDTVSDNDRIIIYAGTYKDIGIGNVSATGLKVCSYGDGLVIIDGSAGSGSFNGNTIIPSNTWVIDGSTGSNLQNIEIIGGENSCIGPTTSTNKSFSVKHVILTGHGDQTADNDRNRTKFGTFRGSTSTQRNCVFRNIRQTAIQAGTGPIYVHNNLIYGCGSDTSDGPIISSPHFNTEIFFNTITGCTGSHGIDLSDSGGDAKNNLLAFNKFTDVGIKAPSTKILNNNVYTDISPASANGPYNTSDSGSVDNSNITADPVFINLNPWDELSGSNVSGDFSLNPGDFHYPGAEERPGIIRGTTGSPNIQTGVTISHISTDFSGSTRTDPPTIGAIDDAGASTFLFSIAGTGVGLADKVLGDFTINHFNRISKETHRSVDQIPFSRAVIGPSNLKDRTTAYKLEKGKQGS